MISPLEEQLMFGGPETASALCGGRFFKRKFNKKDFPILGESEEDFDPEKVIVLRSKDRLPKKLSVSVAAVRELCLDPKTKRWHWPFNGADIVYPNIYLGDE